MRQSMQVLEWQAEARAEGRLEGREEGRQEGREEGRQEGRQEGKCEALLRLLEKRFRRKVPSAIAEKIKATTDHSQLEAWFDAAIDIGSMKEFRELLK